MAGADNLDTTAGAVSSIQCVAGADTLIQWLAPILNTKAEAETSIQYNLYDCTSVRSFGRPRCQQVLG